MADNILYLVINTINGTYPEAIFSNETDAYIYMKRISANSFINTINDNEEDYENLNSTKFIKELYDYTNENYKCILVDHLDKNKPIYAILSGNYRCPGQPEKYLVNTLAEWKVKYGEIIGKDNINDKRWQKTCLIKLNPKLPKLDKVNKKIYQ